MAGAQNSAPERGRPFKPGQSGNPGGRPKQVKELLDLARGDVPEAFALARKFLRDEEVEDRTRLDAAKFIVSYGLGAPPRDPHDTQAAIYVNADLSDEQLQARLDALLAKRNGTPP